MDEQNSDCERWGAKKSELIEFPEIIDQMIDNFIYIAEIEGRRMVQNVEDLRSLIETWTTSEQEAHPWKNLCYRFSMKKTNTIVY